jgi:hypothetical protein
MDPRYRFAFPFDLFLRILAYPVRQKAQTADHTKPRSPQGFDGMSWDTMGICGKQCHIMGFIGLTKCLRRHKQIKKPSLASAFRTNKAYFLTIRKKRETLEKKKPDGL